MNISPNTTALTTALTSIALLLCLLVLLFVFSEEAPGWDMDIQHDVIEECNKHGGVIHIYVDKNSPEVTNSRQLNLDD